MQVDFFEERSSLALATPAASAGESSKIALSGVLSYWLFEKEGYEPVYVNIDGCVECKYFDYRNEEKSVRAHPDEEKWKAALKEMGVKYLLVDTVK